MNFKEYETAHESVYSDFAETVRSLLVQAIKQAEDLPRLQASTARAKESASLKAKLEHRGLLNSQNIEGEIKDIAGVRLIFYTATDVNRFLNSRLIPEMFTIDYSETRVHHPTEENNQRDYRAIHYIVRLSEDQAVPATFARFHGLRCEIQIQTILDHAWAETSHDMVYKAQGSPGFGSHARQALETRMKKIMHDYLRPAGYEFQKAQYDYERLMQGKELFDRGGIETLVNCENNNQRYEALKAIGEHVIPHYDDKQGVYPEICRALRTAVIASKTAPLQPTESALGSLPGKTPKDITIAAVEILDTWRFVIVEETFESLIEIYKAESDSDVRKRIITAVRHLAEYNLNVWQAVGPRVQTALAASMQQISKNDALQYLALFLAAWQELLSVDIEAATPSENQLTISTAALPVIGEVRAIRGEAIRVLLSLFDDSPSDADKIEVISALREATQLPRRVVYSNDICAMVLADTKVIVEHFTQGAARQSYEVLQTIEGDLLFDYRRALQITNNEQFGDCRTIAQELARAIAVFRDRVNADQHYVRYKVLVGDEPFTLLSWDRDEPEFLVLEAYRKNQISSYVDDFSDETAEEWHRLIVRCSTTASVGKGALNLFGDFLRRLSKAKPQFGHSLARLENPPVMRFLSTILTGLYSSDAPDKYADIIERCLSRNCHLDAIATHCCLAGSETFPTVKRVLENAISAAGAIAVFECFRFAIRYWDRQQQSTVDDLFIPAIRYCLSTRRPQWVHGVWFMRECEQFFASLSEDNSDLTLRSLLDLEKVDHHAEKILGLIAVHRPASVWKFFKERLERKSTVKGSYESIPYGLHSLREPLARDINLATQTLRNWYSSGDRDFRFTGGRLLHDVFPDFSHELAASIGVIVSSGTNDDYDFTIALLENYVGETPTHTIVQELINRLPEDDPRLRRLDICLGKTDVVTGQFGWVEAWRRKKEEMRPWLEDARPKVRAFALSYICRIEQSINHEQRSAEMYVELQRREWS